MGQRSNDDWIFGGWNGHSFRCLNPKFWCLNVYSCRWTLNFCRLISHFCWLNPLNHVKSTIFHRFDPSWNLGFALGKCWSVDAERAKKRAALAQGEGMGCWVVPLFSRDSGQCNTGALKRDMYSLLLSITIQNHWYDMIHWTISMIQILNHRNMKTNMITLLSHIHSIYSLTCQDEMQIFRGSWQPNCRMVASHASNIRSVEMTWQWGCRNCFNHSWNILKYTWFGSNEILCASYIRHKKSPLFCGWHRPLWPAMRRAASHAATFPLDPSTCRVSAPAKTFTFRGKKQLFGLLYTMYMPAAAYVLHLNFSLELPFVICLLIKVDKKSFGNSASTFLWRHRPPQFCEVKNAAGWWDRSPNWSNP